MDFYFFTLRKTGAAKTGAAEPFPPALYKGSGEHEQSIGGDHFQNYLSGCSQNLSSPSQVPNTYSRLRVPCSVTDASQKF